MAAPDLSESPERTGLNGGVLTALFVVLVVAAGLFVLLRGGDDDQVAELGGAAPPLSVTTFDGEMFDLASHLSASGTPVLLNLWASWCEPCTREFPALSEYALAHPEVAVVGVAVQDQEEHAREFVRELQPAFRVAWDGDGAVRDAYPSFGLPATFLIDADGTVVDIILAELTPERLESITFG